MLYLPRIISRLESERVFREFVSKGRVLPLRQAYQDARFPATGGSRSTLEDLEEIKTIFVMIGEKHGFPSEKPKSFRAYDADLAVAIGESRFFSGAEALVDDAWEFISVYLLPDLVKWRFGATPARYRGGVRNAFQRLWFRAHSFDRGLGSSDRWGLLYSLTEDAFVQIIERPSIAANHSLALALGESWLEASTIYRKGDIENLMRRASLLLLMRNEVFFIASLPGHEIRAHVSQIFADAANDLGVSPMKEGTKKKGFLAGIKAVLSADNNQSGAK